MAGTRERTNKAIHGFVKAVDVNQSRSRFFQEEAETPWIQAALDPKEQPKWRLYSSLFMLLKQKIRLPDDQVQAFARAADQAFARLIYGNVRSFV